MPNKQSKVFKGDVHCDKVGLIFDGEKTMTCWSKTIKEGEQILSKRAYEKLYENNSYS